MSASAFSSSRSSSPATSDSTSDEHAQSEPLDFSAWCHTFPPDTEGMSVSKVETRTVQTSEEKGMLVLDAFVEENVFNSSALEQTIPVNSTMFQVPQSQQQIKPVLSNSVFCNFSSDNSSSESAAYSDMIPRTTTATVMATRVVPPPPVQARKMDNSTPHRVVFPVKESCYNLAILTPNLAPSGTKSRVETQIRVALDLALTSGSSGDPLNYDRVGSWKWLKLPKGTATRRRSRRDGKIDAPPADTLYLDVEVTCASTPNKSVYICSTCQGRETKRLARKIAARVKPVRSDCESNDGEEESPSKIIQFNCPEILDFSNGSVVLPLRITCYCRHHREKVGFNVGFVMKDGNGRVVGKGISPPIMITDDHKSSDKNPSRQLLTLSGHLGESDWDSRSPFVPTRFELSAHLSGQAGLSTQRAGKRRDSTSRRRSKPYDIRALPIRTKLGDVERQDMRIDGLSPIFDCANPYESLPHSVFSTAPPSPHPSTPNSHSSTVSPALRPAENCDMIRNDLHMQHDIFMPLSPPDTTPSSPPKNESVASPISGAMDPAAFALSLSKQPSESIMAIPPMSRIHRLIPASGPTYGGIEVTVLGSNFYPNVSYNCVFGDIVSSSTARWSENTLVCILPPRAYPGPVTVTLEGIELDPSAGDPAIFTYTDETDRTLMELALQIVGLKMTGKVEEAKDIAMRIVGGSAQEPGDGSMGVNQANQVANLANNALLNSRRLLLRRADDARFENVIMESLLTLDSYDRSTTTSELAHIISQPTKTGQTLLHLAALLKLSSLLKFLILRKIAIDVQDVNGYTALHFAALSGSLECIRHLIAAGADTTICTNMGYTAYEFADEPFFDSVILPEEASSEEDDEESNFGDVEEDAEVESRSNSRLRRRRVRIPRSRRSSVSASVACSDSDGADQFDFRTTAEDDDNATVVSPDSLHVKDGRDRDTILDEKQAASFAAYLYRAWEQFNPPHFMPQILNIPQLPVPAWVFPVFVPMGAWPTFGSNRRKKGFDEKGKGEGSETAADWEKWSTHMSAAMAQHSWGAEMDKPYKSDGRRADDPDESLRIPAVPSPASSRSIFRRFGYNQQQTVPITDQEVKAFSYRHKSKASAKTVKREDRMLVLFWIPTLILVIGWALYSFYPFISSLGQYMH